MVDHKHLACDLTINKVIDLFKDWRSKRKYGEPIPISLWEAAAKQAKDYPASRVAKALRLNYTDLGSP